MTKNSSHPQVNGVVLKELVRRGYSVEGNHKTWNIADSKLWYLTPEQAQAYLDLDSDDCFQKYAGHSQAGSLIEENVDNIVASIGAGPVNLIDLGCGNGTKAVKIIEALKKKGIRVRYCPVDISAHMVESAIKTIQKVDVDEIVEFKYNISDFENLTNLTPLLKKGEYKKNIIMLFGNTLGNFEIHELLYQIKSSMKGDDLFIVDDAINDENQDERAKSYQESKRFYQWLVHVPLKLGLKEEDIKFRVRFQHKRLEMYFEILNDSCIKFHGQEVSFEKGDKIIVVVAYKYNKDDFLSYLNMHFGNVEYHISSDNSKILGICKR